MQYFSTKNTVLGSIVAVLAFLSTGCPENKSSYSPSSNYQSAPTPIPAAPSSINPIVNAQPNSIPPQCEKSATTNSSDPVDQINAQVSRVECLAEPVIQDGQVESQKQGQRVMSFLAQCQQGDQRACQEYNYLMRVRDRNYDAAKEQIKRNYSNLNR
jgi:hypothetical protein